MDVTPHTKVGVLLDAHPEVEDVLIQAVPAFVKLKNPILRATVAKVATLEQAAKVGGLPLPELMGLIWKALGLEAGAAPEGASAVMEAWPNWYREEAVQARLDVNAVLAEGGHPLSKAKQALASHPPGAVVLLQSDFEPAPLLALASKEGLLSACLRQGSTFLTALRRP